jgi:hypothetical protein
VRARETLHDSRVWCNVKHFRLLSRNDPCLQQLHLSKESESQTTPPLVQGVDNYLAVACVVEGGRMKIYADVMVSVRYRAWYRRYRYRPIPPSIGRYRYRSFTPHIYGWLRKTGSRNFYTPANRSPKWAEPPNPLFQIWSPRCITLPKRIREFARQLRQISTRKSASAPTKVKINVNINVNPSRLKSSLTESKEFLHIQRWFNSAKCHAVAPPGGRKRRICVYLFLQNVTTVVLIIHRDRVFNVNFGP